MIYPYLSGVNYESIADGPGIRAAIFLSGCSHNCPGCHNPTTHNPCSGIEIRENVINDIAHRIRSRSYIDGITLTGGDPLYDPQKTLNMLYSLRNRLGDSFSSYSIWLYTGYTWEALMNLYKTDDNIRKILLLTDVVVDGPYIKSLSDKTLAFRGSSNQRIIDVNKSLKYNQVVLWSST